MIIIIILNFLSVYQNLKSIVFFFIAYNLEKSLWTEACYKKLLIGNLKIQKKYF